MSRVELLPLGEIVKPSRPRVKPSDFPDLPFIGMEHVEAHTMKLLGTVLAATMKSSAVHFRPGDVLYGRLRPYLNKIYRPTFEGLCSAEFIVLPENERVDGAYLQYFLNSSAFVRYASHLNAGDRPRVEFDQLASYEIPLPDLDQQRRIVAEIEKQFSRLDEAVANLKRVKADLERYKAAVLKAAVEGRLVPSEAEVARRHGRSFESGAALFDRIRDVRRRMWTGRGKYKEPAGADVTSLSALPEGWAWTSLDSLSWDSGYGTSAKCSREGKGVAVLRIPNVQRGAIDLHDLKAAPSDLLVRPDELVDVGDMLVIRTNGSKALIGRAAVVSQKPTRPLTFASYLIRFRLCAGAGTAHWVNTVWAESRIRTWIEARAATSAGQHNISQSVLATAPIPLPPAEEQIRIAAEVDRRLSIVREVEGEADANLTRANALRQTVLARAYWSGRSGLD